MAEMTDNSNSDEARETLARIIETSSPATLLSCGSLATEISRMWQNHQDGVDVRTLDTIDPNAITAASMKLTKQRSKNNLKKRT